MRIRLVLMLAASVVCGSGACGAQTADEVVEKMLAASGGRAALERLTTRVATGRVTVSSRESDIHGTAEISFKVSNKARSIMRLDLRPLGGGEIVVDQRCDGKSAVAINSQSGAREITGSQLQNMLNASFPTPLLRLKESGGRVEVAGRETVRGRPAIILVYTPKAGPVSRLAVDAETWLVLRTVVRLDIPDMGGEIEQISEPSNYRSVDGITLPFTVVTSTSVQKVTLRFDKIEHNKPLDDAMFARPAAK
jgi:outer membrane lipoprotein-sorting protein